MLIDIEYKNNQICLSLDDNKISEHEYVEQSECKIQRGLSVKEIRDCYDNMRKRYDDFDTKIQIVDYISMFRNFKSGLSSKENINLLSVKMDDIRTKFNVVHSYDIPSDYDTYYKPIKLL